jgi:FtsP/CotA-like multicopper oxidase with cupredoxin domain
MTRRNFLTLSSITALWIFTGCGGGGTNSSKIDLPNNNQKNKLMIPPLLEGTLKNGIREYQLTIQESIHKFFDKYETATYAINGSYLGPTLRLINGEQVSINYTNRLKENTTIHGHGMHVPANMDGATHQIIKPNTTWSAQYTVNQEASSNWYHPHLMGKTAEHVYKGLAGFIYVEDEEKSALDLPKRYGIDDIPLVLQDRFFDANGQLDYAPSRREIRHGYHGDIFITNGTVDAQIDVEAKEIRFRILNGSNSTVYNLAFEDGRVFKQIATDNSLLEAPVALTSLRLSPAERAEIVVDFSDSFGQSITFKDKTQNKAFLEVTINKEASITTKIPEKLKTLEFFSLNDAVKTRKFNLSGKRGELLINDKQMNMIRIDERVSLNQIEIWEVTNEMEMDHNFHIHATHFTIAERNGSYANVANNEKGYKDTVYLAPNDSVKLLVKMVDFTDSKLPYMYHCHFLEHEDAGMMGQFTVE